MKFQNVYGKDGIFSCGGKKYSFTDPADEKNRNQVCIKKNEYLLFTKLEGKGDAPAVQAIIADTPTELPDLPKDTEDFSSE